MTHEMSSMKQEVGAAIAEACKQLFDVTDVRAECTRPDEQFGDYASNVALQLAGKLGKKPRDVAELLAEKLRELLGDKADSVSVAGPGFLNVKLGDSALVAEVERDKTIGDDKSLAGQT